MFSLDRAEGIALAKRLLALDEKKTTAMAPEGEAPYFIDVSNFTDAGQFAREKELLFRRTPLLMAFSSDIAEPGDFITNDYTGIPVLIVRSEAGTAKAFLNVCRHRAARLKADISGKDCHRIVCPFHAWTYDLDGKLASVFTEGKFGRIDKAAHGLIALPAAEKYGMIFVTPAPGAPIDIDSHLGSLASETASWNFGSLTPFERREFRMRTNWKLALDTYFEGYHAVPLHPTTIGPMIGQETMTFDAYGRHFRVAFASKSIRELRGLPEEQWEPLRHMGVLYFIFPNVCLTTGTFGLNHFEIYPGQTPGEHVTLFRHYAPTALETEAERKATQDWFDFIYDVIKDEDYRAAEGIYEGLACGLHPYSVLGRNELALIYMQRNFRDAVGLDAAGLGHFKAAAE